MVTVKVFTQLVATVDGTTIVLEPHHVELIRWLKCQANGSGRIQAIKFVRAEYISEDITEHRLAAAKEIVDAL